MALDLPSFSRGRLQRELKHWDRMPPVGFKHRVNTNNIYRWIIEWTPQAGTLYAGESFKFQIDFPVDYPYEPPSIVFLDPIPLNEHVYSNGVICIDILLRHIWSAGMSIETICLSILSMFVDSKVKKLPDDNMLYVSKISICRVLEQIKWFFTTLPFRLEKNASYRPLDFHPLDFHPCSKGSPPMIWEFVDSVNKSG